MAVRATVDEVHRVISAAVDPAFYRAAYPELDRPDLDPVTHYAAAGWREGRDPAPWFSAEAYLAANADVRRLGVEPFYHYLLVGRREGREVRPSREGPAYLRARLRRSEPAGWGFEPPAARAPVLEVPDLPPAPLEAAVADHDRSVAAAEFDAAYYLDTNPDVAAAGTDPLHHFLQQGWREGRDPNMRFSTRDYLDANPDIAAAGVNPFVHYLVAGRAEGRAPRHSLGFRYETLAHLKPVTERVAAIRAMKAPKAGTEAELAAALAKSRTGLADLHVTFSHDDYTANVGGMQLCLQREDAEIAALKRDHLHLYPAKPWPVVRAGREPGQLGVVWNGRRVGVFPPKTVCEVLAVAARGKKARNRSFAIHSLLGHTAGEAADILEAVGLKAGWFWLHDFTSLCAGYHLLRNDVEDCAAPPIDSAACSICAYLPMRARHLAEHQRLFERLELTVVSPSKPTLDLWKASSAYPHAGEVILPHATLVDRGAAPVPRKPRPLRVAYAGMPIPYKGWPIFKALALDHAEDERYQFLHLGVRPIRGLPAEFHEVAVTAARPRLMQETLERLEVDAVLVWPLCRETFSFIAYEAVAGGCAIITGPDSGNVQAFVLEGGHGWVLPDEGALTQAFASGEVAQLARARRKPRLYDLKFSPLTVDLLRPRTGA